MATSSIPLPCTISATAQPSRCRAPAIGSIHSGRATPKSIRDGRAGLISGPSRLKIVGTPQHATHLRGMPQPGMIGGREQKTDSMAVERPPSDGRIDVGGDAQRLQQVERAAAAGDRTVAVLDDRHTARGGGEGDERGEVERVLPVAAGADDVGELDLRAGKGGRRLEQRRGGCGKFLGGRAADLNGRDGGGQQRRFDRAVHHRGEERRGFRGTQRAAAEQRLNERQDVSHRSLRSAAPPADRRATPASGRAGGSPAA